MADLSDATLPGGETMQIILFACRIIVIACVAIAIIIVVTLFISRFRTRYLDKRVARLEDEYASLLAEAIFDEDERSVHKHETARLKEACSGSHFRKKIMRRQILQLHRNLTGQSGEILREVYDNLGLHTEALRELRNTNWSTKAGAVRELGHMHCTEAASRILKLTSHKNPILRMEAQAAMLSLDKENPFGFLAFTNTEITPWQQLNLEGIINDRQMKVIPVFSQWFGLPNPTVVQFCVKMTVMFNQFESADALTGLLQAKDERVVKETVKALGSMLISEAQQELISCYANTTDEIRKEILNSLGRMGGEAATPFLKEILYTGSYELAMRAGKALLDSGAEDILLQAKSSDHELAAAVAAHMSDHRIEQL